MAGAAPRAHEALPPERRVALEELELPAALPHKRRAPAGCGGPIWGGDLHGGAPVHALHALVRPSERLQARHAEDGGALGAAHSPRHAAAPRGLVVTAAGGGGRGGGGRGGGTRALLLPIPPQGVAVVTRGGVWVRHDATEVAEGVGRVVTVRRQRLHTQALPKYPHARLGKRCPGCCCCCCAAAALDAAAPTAAALVVVANDNHVFIGARAFAVAVLLLVDVQGRGGFVVSAREAPIVPPPREAGALARATEDGRDEAALPLELPLQADPRPAC